MYKCITHFFSYTTYGVVWITMCACVYNKVHGVGSSIENSWLHIFFHSYVVLPCAFVLFLYTSKCMYRPVSWTTAVEENRIVESEYNIQKIVNTPN